MTPIAFLQDPSQVRIYSQSFLLHLANGPIDLTAQEAADPSSLLRSNASFPPPVSPCSGCWP